jgi:nucleoside-diphosphate-sugar epimerase
LAAVPGGTAEQDPALSLRVNVEGTIALMTRLSTSNVAPRFVYASSIAVYGDPLPAAGVNDQTPLRPKLYYGMHKLMAEQALATLSRRGEIDGVGLRLPGIVARPKGPSGMKSAFMSDIFHALKSGEDITLPVSREATLWLMSVKTCAQNLVAALTLDRNKMPENCVVTLQALKVEMAALVTQVCAHLSTSDDRVSYAPDAGLEAAFGTYPDLQALAAERAGLFGEKSAAQLVSNVLGA